MRIRDLGILFSLDPGWKIFGSGIRDKHPGSQPGCEEIRCIGWMYSKSGTFWLFSDPDQE